ncbi:MAG: response regulator receiver protein, partial [Micrococcales bacterium]
MTSVVFAISDGNLASDLTGILRELGDYEVRGQATTTDQARDLVARVQPEVLFVHEEIGPQPLHQTVRDLSAGYPDTSVLVISGARTSGKVIKALEAGARGVVAHPFAYEDVSSNASTARQWSEAIRATRKGIARVVSQRGSVVTVAGSKGGVGTTTIATHLALDYLAEKPDGRVCLVDADVEKGDVGAILEARQGVSIADVAKVADDMTAQTVNDALIHHETGIRLLLAPADVRAAEYVTPVALRAIVTVLREEFDLVVLDAGGHVSPTQAAAVEAADEVLIVTTADVMAVRAMRLRIQAWESLGVRHEAECKVLVN